MVKFVTLVGNAYKPSRVHVLADYIAKRLSEKGAVSAGLVDFSDPALASLGKPATALLELVMASDLVVVVCPIYKGSMPGQLKNFFDYMEQGALSGNVAIPVMVGAAPHHALAVEYTVKPVLSQLGALSLPGALFIHDQEIDREQSVISAEVQDKLEPALTKAVALTVATR
ncbi:MAG: reductase [Firmicutes bacterium]|nr:reductase [Bacillota bacterium]